MHGRANKVNISSQTVDSFYLVVENPMMDFASSELLKVCNQLSLRWKNNRDNQERITKIFDSDLDSDLRGRLCLDLASTCLKEKLSVEAIVFSMNSILLRPRTWAAFNILRKSYKNLGLINEADECGRKKIPKDLLRTYLPGVEFPYIDARASHCKTIEVLFAFSSEKTSLKQPLSVLPLESRAYDHTQICSNDGYTVKIDSGRLWFDGFNIMAWDSEDRIVNDASAGYPEVIHCAKEFEQITSLKGTVCFLGNRVASNYYHWMHDILPRIGVLKDSGIDIDSIDHFVLPSVQKPFQKESLEYYGITSEKIHRFPNGKYIQADCLLMPVYGSNEHLVRVDTEQWMNLHSLQSPRSAQFLGSDLFKTPNHCGDTVSSKRIYISRGSTGSRSITNEEQLIEFLENYGFMVLRTETHTMEQQAQIFRNAEVVFGPHGAGFSNIVFCKEKTKIIEIYQDYTASCFWFLSEFLNLEHYAHKCISIDESEFL